MKKFVSVFLMLFAVIFLGGCQKTQVLTCETSDDSNGLKTTQTYQMTYKGEDVKEAKIMTEFELEDSSYYDEYVEVMDKTFNDIEETEGITIDTNSDKPVYSVDITIDFDKVADDAKVEELDLDMSEAEYKETIDELKKEMEKEGMTCNIK